MENNTQSNQNQEDIIEIEEKKSPAQEWLDKNYPKESRKDIKKLYIWSKNLSGSLEIKDFIELEDCRCFYNELTSLKVNNCPKLTVLHCWHNNLTNLDIKECINLRELNCYGNQLSDLDISNCNKLVVLHVWDNKLKILNVSNCPSLLEICYGQNLFSNSEKSKLKRYERDDNDDSLFNVDNEKERWEYLISKKQCTDNQEKKNNHLNKEVEGHGNSSASKSHEEKDPKKKKNFFPWKLLPHSKMKSETETNNASTEEGIKELRIQLVQKEEEIKELYQQSLLQKSESKQKEVVELQKENQNLWNQLNEIFDIVLPDNTFDSSTLKSEVKKLKTESLSYQIKVRKLEFDNLVTEAKKKLNEELFYILDTIIETQKDIYGSSNDSFVEGLVQKSKISLSRWIDKKEIDDICRKQKEITQLEEVTNFLGIYQEKDDKKKFDMIELEKDKRVEQQEYQAQISINIK